MRAFKSGLVAFGVVIAVAGPAFAAGASKDAVPMVSECSGHCASDLAAASTVVVKK